MALTESPSSQTAGVRVLDELLRERGLHPGSYALFFVVGEGNFFPEPRSADPIEEVSGFVLDTSGAVHAFWLEWDAQQRRPVLSEWKCVEPEPSWADETEYQEAQQLLK